MRQSESAVNFFEQLKKEIYTLYVRISKEQFFGTPTEVQEHEFDSLLASVCVANLSGDIAENEFQELSGCLVRTYEVFRLRKESVRYA